MATITTTESRLLSVRRDKQIGSSSGGYAVAGGGSSTTGVSGGITAHSLLTQLDYASAGHTGFAPIDNPTFTTKITTPALKVTTGAAAGAILISDASGDLSYLAAGTTAQILVGGGAANPVWTTATGTGAPVRADSPTLTTLVSLTGASNPNYRVTDSTNSVITKLQSLDSQGLVGTESNHDFQLRANNVIVVNVTTSGNLVQPSFSTGFQGTNWRIQADGDAEFENVFIRGGLTVSELIINQLHYQNGGLIIGAGAGKIATVEDDTLGSEILTFHDPEGNELIPFTEGAIVKMQKVDIDRTTVVRVIVREVSGVEGSSGGGFTVEFTETAGWVAADDDVGVFEVGDEVCAIGHVSDTNLDSSIYISATDTDNPFLRVLDAVDSYADWSTVGASVKLQLGNLASLADYDDGNFVMPSDPGYGLYSDNVYLTGKIVADTGYIGGAGGWVISTGYIKDVAGVVGLSAVVTGGDDIRFWAGHATPASAPFQVTEAGALTATGTIELGTAAVSVAGTLQNLAIKGPDIWEDSYNGIANIYINRLGYDGGATQYRNTIIGDGKDNAIVTFIGGARGTVSFNGDILMVTGAITFTGGNTPSYMFQKTPSGTARNSHDAEASTVGSGYTKLKTITLTFGLLGEQRFYFDIKFVDNGGEGTTAYGKIYRNGIALGTEQSTSSTTYVTKNEDLIQIWNPGDTVELWCKTDDGGEDDEVYVENFRICYDDSPVVAVASSNS